jgi:hypothetical protein
MSIDKPGFYEIISPDSSSKIVLYKGEKEAEAYIVYDFQNNPLSLMTDFVSVRLIESPENEISELRDLAKWMETEAKNLKDYSQSQPKCTTPLDNFILSDEKNP